MAAIDPMSAYIAFRRGNSVINQTLHEAEMLMTDEEIIDRFVRPMLAAVRQREADMAALPPEGVVRAV